MPGTYAPPAVELPNTSATVGSPAADARVRSRNIRPPGTMISFWAADPRLRFHQMHAGEPFSAAISAPERLLQGPRVAGAAAHGGVVGGHHALDAPRSTPMPVTTLAPTG
jgi:hypothetical protein